MSFHGNHGSNVVLSDNNKTATRKNEDIKINGVLFSSAPLQKGETFEVVLLKKDSTKKGGIEIGITSNNPSSFDMVRTMTDCVKGTTYMLSDNKVVKNGKAVDMMNNRLNNLQVNGQLGVRRDASGAKLDFLLDGQCQIKVDVDAGTTYWAVVDLYGQAVEVAVAGGPKTTKPTAEALPDMVSQMSTLVGLLKEKSKTNFVKVKELVTALDEGYHGRLKKREDRKKLAGKLAEQNGGRVISDYFVFLRSLDLDEDPIKDIYLELRSICWNYSDSSRILAADFGKCGLLDLMVADLKRFRDTYQKSKPRSVIVYTAFGIIHNCAKETSNQEILRKLHFMEVATPYSSTEKHNKEIVMNAVMSMSYVMEENEASLARLQKDTMLMVLVRLKNAITTEDTRQADGWHAYEICDGLANLAQDFENLKFVVSSTGVRLFVALLIAGKEEDHERVSALRAIDAHTIRQSARTVGETPKLIELLMMIKERDPLKEARELAASTLKKLEEHPDFKSFSSKKDGSLKGKMPSPRSSGDIKIAGQVVPTMSASCQYAALCTTFFKSLDLMAPFFDTTFNQCYCDNCHKKRGDKEFYSRGDPPEKYGIPIGWYRFALMLPPKAKALGVEKKWHRAFHGTKHSSLSKILEVGELVAAGRPILGGKEIFERSGHYTDDNKPKGFDTKNVFLSPSIKYAGHQAYATSQPWSDSDGKKYKTQVAFQVFISPGCYKVGPQTVLPSGSSVKIDTLFDNSKLEWFTNQQGSTILYGLLVKVAEA